MNRKSIEVAAYGLIVVAMAVLSVVTKTAIIGHFTAVTLEVLSRTAWIVLVIAIQIASPIIGLSVTAIVLDLSRRRGPRTGSIIVACWALVWLLATPASEVAGGIKHSIDSVSSALSSASWRTLLEVLRVGMGLLLVSVVVACLQVALSFIFGSLTSSLKDPYFSVPNRRFGSFFVLVSGLVFLAKFEEVLGAEILGVLWVIGLFWGAFFCIVWSALVERSIEQLRPRIERAGDHLTVT